MLGSCFGRTAKSHCRGRFCVFQMQKLLCTGIKQPRRWPSRPIRQCLQRKSHQQPGDKGLLLFSISQTGVLRTLPLQDVDNEEGVLWCGFMICLDGSPSQSLWSLAAHCDPPWGAPGEPVPQRESAQKPSSGSPSLWLRHLVGCRTPMGKVCLWASGPLPCPREVWCSGCVSVICTVATWRKQHSVVLHTSHNTVPSPIANYWLVHKNKTAGAAAGAPCPGSADAMWQRFHVASVS